jgi:hypothetical protein
MGLTFVAAPAYPIDPLITAGCGTSMVPGNCEFFLAKVSNLTAP